MENERMGIKWSREETILAFDLYCRTKNWIMGYADHQIILPDKFLPGKKFIEYHNDVIFQR